MEKPAVSAKGASGFFRYPFIVLAVNKSLSLIYQKRSSIGEILKHRLENNIMVHIPQKNSAHHRIVEIIAWV